MLAKHTNKSVRIDPEPNRMSCEKKACSIDPIPEKEWTEQSVDFSLLLAHDIHDIHQSPFVLLSVYVFSIRDMANQTLACESRRLFRCFTRVDSRKLIRHIPGVSLILVRAVRISFNNYIRCLFPSPLRKKKNIWSQIVSRVCFSKLSEMEYIFCAFKGNLRCRLPRPMRWRKVIDCMYGLLREVWLLFDSNIFIKV